jgi:hypothetical protein
MPHLQLLAIPIPFREWLESWLRWPDRWPLRMVQQNGSFRIGLALR